MNEEEQKQEGAVSDNASAPAENTHSEAVESNEAAPAEAPSEEARG